jgi:DNA-binding response OmpR family regulator
MEPHLVVTDISAQHEGIELCRRLAESALPIIVLSVKGEEKTKVEALTQGRTTTPSAGGHG